MKLQAAGRKLGLDPRDDYNAPTPTGNYKAPPAKFPMPRVALSTGTSEIDSTITTPISSSTTHHDYAQDQLLEDLAAAELAGRNTKAMDYMEEEEEESEPHGPGQGSNRAKQTYRCFPMNTAAMNMTPQKLMSSSSSSLPPSKC